ncbi:MAG: multicopper oxidase family protein [Polyangiales bacterium]
MSLSIRIAPLSALVLGCALLVGACNETSGTSTAPDASAPDAAVDVTPDAAVDVAPDAAPSLPSLVGPPDFEDHNPDPHVVEVDLVASSGAAELVAGRMTDSKLYNGRTPGPTLHARVGDRVVVHFRNDLDEPTTIHWHGLRIPSAMDGNPMVQPPVMPGETFDYDFVVPDAGTFWYHPHINTIEQLDRGLYGAIVVHEAEAPRFTAERVFVLDDVRLDAQGQISPFATAGHDTVHGRAGNVLLLNGASARVTASAPRNSVERWRLLNAAGSRVMSVAVEGASWRVVGTDGGLVPQPFNATRLSIAPGQRYDLEVTLDGEMGPAQLVTYVLAQTDAGVQTVPRTIAELRYEGEVAAASPVYPRVELPALAASPMEQTIRLGATTTGALRFTIDGHSHEEGDEPMLTFAQRAPVRFTIVNEIAPEHPFHLHGQFFQILSRNGRDAREPGLKDTVQLGAMERVVIETHFENPGRWMYHCHIPEHAENGMMAELMVTPAP